MRRVFDVSEKSAMTIEISTNDVAHCGVWRRPKEILRIRQNLIFGTRDDTRIMLY